MADIPSIVGIVGGAIGAVGGTGGLVAVWREWRQAKRETTQDVWGSFKEQIASAEARDDTEEAARVRREYEAQQEAWRAQQGVVALAPKEMAPWEGAALTSEEVAQLKDLLAGSDVLLPSLLSAQDYLSRGNAYYRSGEYEKALEAYNRSLELRPEQPDTLTNRGVALYRLGRHEEALADHNRSLEIRPDNPDAVGNRGITLLNLRRYDEALAQFKRALELRPNHANTFYNKACLFSVWGKPRESIEWLEKAIRGDEKYRAMARNDEDFDNVRNDPEYGPRFRELVGEDESARD